MGQFHFVTAGESHGKGLVAVIEGIVARLSLTEEYIARDLKRRQAGYGRSSRMGIEQDRAEIISGVRHGLTIGSPISLLIWNRVWEKWQETMSIASVDKEAEPITSPRPGHADLAGVIKYGAEDIRPILERASARETAARVAVGAVARRFVEEFGVSERTLQRLFQRYVGVSPKWVLRRYRLHDAMTFIDRGRTDLAELAAALGWTDQSHFTNEFRAVVGMTPGEYQRQAK